MAIVNKNRDVSFMMAGDKKRKANFCQLEKVRPMLAEIKREQLK